MSCRICGRPSAAGAKLCADCRAARKRAYDATITQPLMALAGAGSVSRTLSRLRRSDTSPEAEARRAARKAKAAAAVAATAASAAMAPSSARGATKSRALLWILLSIGLALAAVAGWYLPTHTPTAPALEEQPANASPASSRSVTSGVEPAGVAPSPAADVTALPPLPNIVEQELVPHSPATAKPAQSKRAIATPKVAPAAIEPPPETEIVRAPPPVPAQAPAPPAPRVDPWQQMSEAIGRCPGSFLDHVVCEQRIRLQYCDGHWGQVPQCPGGPSADHD